MFFILFLLLVLRVVVISSTNSQLNSSSLFVLRNTDNLLVASSIADLDVDEPASKVWFCWSEYATRRPAGYGANAVKISGIALNMCIKVYSDENRGVFRYAYKLSKIVDDTRAVKYTYFNDPDCTQRDIAYRRSFGYLFYMYGQAGLYVTDAEGLEQFLTPDDKIPLPIGVSFAVNLTFDNYFSCNTTTTTDVSQAYRFAAYRQDYCFSMLPRLGSFGSLYRLPFVRYSDHSCTWCGLTDIIDMNTCQTVKTITRVNLGDCDYIWKIYDIPYDNNPTMPTRPMLNVDSYVELPEHRQLYKRWIVMYTPDPTTSPTIAPTITPTWTSEPSPEPSTEPSSAEPTTQPSPEPSLEPTTQPSPAPTTTPAPSHTPGSDRNTYNFNVEQILVGISSLTYASQYTLHNSIVRDTIGDVLNIPPIWVTILTVSTLSPINININPLSVLRFTSLAITDRCLVKYKVQFNTTAMNNKQYIDKPELVYHNLTALLINSINNSTQFTDILHYKAEQQGVTVFNEVTSDVPKTTAFKPDYVYIDGTSSKKPSRDTLIWSIFCSVLVSVCWLYLGVHYCRKYYLKRRENRAVVPVREDIELTEHSTNDNSIAASGSGNSVNDDNVSVRSGAAVYEQAIMIENDNHSDDQNSTTRIETITDNARNTEQTTHTVSTPVLPFEVIEIVTNGSYKASEQKIDEHGEKVDFSDEEKPDFGVKIKLSQSKSTTLRLKPKSTPAAQHRYAVAVSNNNEDEMIDIETQDFDNYIV